MNEKAKVIWKLKWILVKKIICGRRINSRHKKKLFVAVG